VKKVTMLFLFVFMMLPATAFSQQPPPKGKPAASAELDWDTILEQLQKGDSRVAYSTLAPAGALSPDVLAGHFTRLSREKPEEFAAAWSASELLRNLFNNKVVPAMRGKLLKSILALASDKAAARLPALSLLVTGGYPASDVYKAALEDDDAAIRAAAASGLGCSLPEVSTLDKLARMAKSDEAAEVRAASIMTLANCGRQQDVATVIAACADKAPLVRKTAVKALITVPTAATAEVLATVITNENEDRKTRLDAMRPAAILEHPKLSQALIKALDDKDAGIRRGAYQTLCASRIPDVLEKTCEKILNERDPGAVNAFIESARHFELSIRCFPTLRRMLVSTIISKYRQAGTPVGTSAVRALRSIPFREVTEQLGALVAADGNSAIKMFACRVLWDNKSRDATALFIALLSDEDMSVSRTAATALKGRNDERTATAALKLLSGAERPLRLDLVELLSDSAEEEALKLLRGLLQTGSVKEKVTVIQGVQRKRNRALCSEIVGLLENESRSVRLASVSTLGTLGYEPAVKKLSELAGKTRDEGARYFMVKALAEIGTAESVGVALKHFGGFSAPRQQSLSFVLIKLTDPKAKEVLAASPVYEKVEEQKKSRELPDPRAEAEMRRNKLLAKYKAKSAKELRSLAELVLTKSDPRRPAENWEIAVTAMAGAWPKEALAYLREIMGEYPHWRMLMAAAARILQEHPLEGSAEVLKDLLYKPDAFVRLSAASALAQSEKGMAVLRAATASDYRVVSKTAFVVLANRGELSEEKLAEALKAPSWSVRRAAAQALSKSPSLVEAEWLGAALDNDEPGVRRIIAHALAKSASAKLPGAVRDAFNSDMRTRFRCFEACIRAEPQTAWELISSRALTMKDDGAARKAIEEIAVAASFALEEEYLALLAKQMNDPDKTKVALAAAALVAPGEGRDADWWKKWLKERKPGFHWSERDCRFLSKNKQSDK
jgi:HEAT repeat protein